MATSNYRCINTSSSSHGLKFINASSLRGVAYRRRSEATDFRHHSQNLSGFLAAFNCLNLQPAARQSCGGLTTVYLHEPPCLHDLHSIRESPLNNAHIRSHIMITFHGYRILD